MDGTAIQIEQALPVQGGVDQDPRHKRDLIAPLVLGIGGGLTMAWVGFLGWAALRLTTYVFS